MVGVWGEGHILQIYKICTQEHVSGFGKREEDRRGLEWNKKEMPSLATKKFKTRVSLW